MKETEKTMRTLVETENALNTVTVGGDDHSGTYGMVPVQCPLPHPDAVSLSSPHRS